MYDPRKVHKISTILSVACGGIGAVLLFLIFVDRVFDLNIIGSQFEPFLLLLGVLDGILFALSTLVSIVLSLYFVSEK